MNKKMFYSQSFEWIIGLIALGCMLLAAWTFRSITILPIIALASTPVISFLIIKNKDQFKDGITTVHYATGLCTIIAVVCLLGVLFSNNRHICYFESLFVKGRYFHMEVFIEGDGETVDHYQTSYFFTPASNNGEQWAALCDFIFISLALGSVYINYQIWLKAKLPKSKSKYEYNY